MFTTTELQILTIFFSNPDKGYYFSEIGRILNKKPGEFQRSINSLEKQGMITSFKKGNQRIFKINKNYHLFNEIKSIVQKTGGVEGLLKNLVDNIKGIATALIFGSYAKDKLHIDSDIDLLLIVKNLKIENSLLEKLEKIEQKIQKEINYKIYTQKEFNDKRREKEPFLEEILLDKYILLKGKIW